LAARVYGEPIYRRTNFPGDHSLWRGGLYPSVPAVRKTLDDADVILIVGADVFTWFLHGPGAPFRPGVPVIQLADDPRQIRRRSPVDRACGTAITPTLRPIAAERAARLSDAQRAAAADRRAQLERVRVDFMARTRAAAEAEAGRAPISPAHLMHTLAGLLPDDAVIVGESAASLPPVLPPLPLRRPRSFSS